MLVTRTPMMLHRQNGFTLAVALLIVGLISGILATIIQTQTSGKREQEARIAGWQAVQIARAARLHVRDMITFADPAQIAALGASTAREYVAILANEADATAREIDIADLIAENLLPANFARTDADDNYVNTLGQRIHVLMGNYPLQGDPADENTIPTAYVYFAEDAVNPVSSGELTQVVVQGARAEGVPVSAPLYNNGVNLSGICDTLNPINDAHPVTVLWDSGCLDDLEFLSLTGEPYRIGSFVLPAWRSVNFDTRAVMRYPQPEQTTLQTMQTDLVMAAMESDCVTNSILIPSDNDADNNGILEDMDTYVCGAQSDDVTTSTDNRRSILNVSDLLSTSLIIAPQSGDDVATGGADAADNAHDLFIGGNLTVNGDTKVYDGSTTIDQNLSVSKNITVSSDGAFPATSNIGDINARNATFSSLSADGINTINGELKVRNALTNVGNLTVDKQTIVEILESATDITPQIAIVGNTTILQQTSGEAPLRTSNLEVHAFGAVNGTPYNVLVARIQANSASMISLQPIEVSNGVTVTGDVETSRIDVTNPQGSATCYGDCPLRTESEQCRRAAESGYTSYEDCMDRLR